MYELHLSPFGRLMNVSQIASLLHLIGDNLRSYFSWEAFSHLYNKTISAGCPVWWNEVFKLTRLTLMSGSGDEQQEAAHAESCRCHSHHSSHSRYADNPSLARQVWVAVQSHHDRVALLRRPLLLVPHIEFRRALCWEAHRTNRISYKQTNK